MSFINISLCHESVHTEMQPTEISVPWNANKCILKLHNYRFQSPVLRISVHWICMPWINAYWMPPTQISVPWNANKCSLNSLFSIQYILKFTLNIFQCSEIQISGYWISFAVSSANWNCPTTDFRALNYE